jgi:hypothetical protein
MQIASLRTQIVVCAFTLLGLSSAASAEETVSLKPDWTPGRTTYVEFTWDTKTAWTLGKSRLGPSHQTTHLTVGYLHKVESVSKSGAARITLTLDRVAFTYQHFLTKRSFDTDEREKPRSEKDRLGKMLLSLLGKPMVLDVGETGTIRVCWTGGLDDLLESQAGDAEDLVDFALKVMFRPSQQENAWQLFYGCYAFRDASVGDSWKHFIEVMPVVENYPIIYSLDGFEKRDDHSCAVISYTARQPKSKRWRDITDRLQSQNGPCSLKGSALIDVEKAQIIQATATSTEKSRDQWLDRDGKVRSMDTTKKSRRQTMLTMSEEERRAQKEERRKGQSGEPLP